MSWLNALLKGAELGLSIYGGYRASQDAGSYYSQLADIQAQNAATRQANTNLAIDAREKKTKWDLDFADIEYRRSGLDYEAAGITLENQRLVTDYKVQVAENEAAFNAYMEALSGRHAAEAADIALGKKLETDKIAEETEVLEQKVATQRYDERMDQVRHVVAETAAKGGRSGFRINAGSFMSALNDETGMANLYATGDKDSAFESARLGKEAALLRADETYREGMMGAENLTATGERYKLAGKINLEEAKLAQALYGLDVARYGLAGGAYGLAGERFGLAQDQFDFGMGQIGSYRKLAQDQYDTDMGEVNVTRGRASNAYNSTWFNSVLPAVRFAQALYGKK